MLKREPGALDLARVGLAAQLLDQLGALRKAGGTQRVPLREKPPRGIGDVLSAIGIVAIIDELPGLAVPAEAEGLVGDELVLGKAVVQLHHVNVFRAHASRFVRQGARRIASTSGYQQLDTVAFRNADDGSVALLVVNSAKQPRSFAVRVGQRSFDYTLPATSVATFSWQSAGNK